MGYRIHYAVGGETLRATVLGKSSLSHAARIARDIAEQAAQRAIKQLLIDVRGLVDRVGTLGTLVLATCRPVSDCRVALLDTRPLPPDPRGRRAQPRLRRALLRRSCCGAHLAALERRLGNRPVLHAPRAAVKQRHRRDLHHVIEVVVVEARVQVEAARLGGCGDERHGDSREHPA